MKSDEKVFMKSHAIIDVIKTVWFPLLALDCSRFTTFTAIKMCFGWQNSSLLHKHKHRSAWHYGNQQFFSERFAFDTENKSKIFQIVLERQNLMKIYIILFVMVAILEKSEAVDCVLLLYCTLLFYRNALTLINPPNAVICSNAMNAAIISIIFIDFLFVIQHAVEFKGSHILCKRLQNINVNEKKKSQIFCRVPFVLNK